MDTLIGCFCNLFGGKAEGIGYKTKISKSVIQNMMTFVIFLACMYEAIIFHSGNKMILYFVLFSLYILLYSKIACVKIKQALQCTYLLKDSCLNFKRCI